MNNSDYRDTCIMHTHTPNTFPSY
ncbi:unnamed protein product [Nyctereutes procyonoides]|uniref:(raccoon dog) hypothetical protein n=1 Tax=Nyctereutes procyonoides TaxID=34880 RepID=A0A811ZEF4_NYCPR|nr:unnamed protein product [Nyctereutes procyonoides]